MTIGQFVLLKEIYTVDQQLAKFPLPFIISEIYGKDYGQGFSDQQINAPTIETWAQTQNPLDSMPEVKVIRRIPPETLTLIRKRWYPLSEEKYGKTIEFPSEIYLYNPN